MELENYDLGITLAYRAAVENRAKYVDGICGTISAITILEHFEISISDMDIKEGLYDCESGTNQVNMAVFMANNLDVTYCVNHDIKSKIEEENPSIKPEDLPEFQRLLNNENIHFLETPELSEIVRICKEENAVAQFVFLEDGAAMTHYGVLCKVENDILEFSQREKQTGRPDVTIDQLISWWDLNGTSIQDPEKLVLIYKAIQI